MDHFKNPPPSLSLLLEYSHILATSTTKGSIFIWDISGAGQSQPRRGKKKKKKETKAIVFTWMNILVV